MTTQALVTDTDIFNKICIRIIKEQANIVGTLSWEEAGRVEGLKIIDRYAPKIQITGDPKKVINDLVESYVKLFGRLSREVSRESVIDLTSEIPAEDVPSSLK